MALRFNNAEGVTIGTNLTAAATAPGGDQFSSVTLAGSGTLQGSSSAPLAGSTSYVTSAPVSGDSVTTNWNETTNPATGGWSVLWAFVSGTGTNGLLTIRGAAGAMASLALNNVTGVLSVLDVNGTTVLSSPASTVPLDGTKVGIEYVVDPGTTTTDGKVNVAVWTGTPLTLAWTQELTGQNFFRSGGIASRRWGKLSALGTGGSTYKWDSLATLDSYVLPGFAVPATVVAPLATASALAPVPSVNGNGNASVTAPLATASALARVAGVATSIPTANYDIILLVGQSNMRGAATDYDAAGVDAYPASVYQTTWSGATPATIAKANEPLYSQDAGAGMGAGHNFATAWATNRLTPGRSVLVVNAARGGTGFSLPSTGDDTSATWQVDTADDGHNLAWNTVRAAQAALTLAGTGSKIVAVLANHGSTDGINNQPKATFKARLNTWLDFVRTQLNLGTTPYLMMQMRPSLFGENRHLIIDQAQQELAAEKPWVQFVASPVGSAYEKADSVHFNALGVRTIGTNLYGLLDTADAGAPLATASAMAYAPTVTTSGVGTVAAVQATASALARVPGVSAQQVAAVTVPLAGASAASRVPTVTGELLGGATVVAVAATASGLARAPQLTTQRSAVTVAVVANALSQAFAPVVQGVGPISDQADNTMREIEPPSPALERMFGRSTGYHWSDLTDSGD